MSMTARAWARTIATLWVLGPAAGLAQDIEPPFFVGRAVCTECHQDGAAAGPCRLEPIPAHDRAYKALRRPEAEAIAVLSGVIGPPERSRMCLGCHATAADVGPRWTRPPFAVGDGVQCEACHDAGSRHVEAVRATDVPRASPERQIRRGDRAVCATCHVTRPSHEDVLRGGFRLEAADRGYKTPVNLTISTDGRRLYAVCERSDSIVVVDLEAGRAVSEIRVGRRPFAAALAPDGRTLFVTNRLADTMSVVDLRSGDVRAAVSTGHEPHGVLADPAGLRVYVLNYGEDTISVIDGKQLKETARLSAGRGPWAGALSPDGDVLHATNLRPAPAGFREPHHSEVTVASLTDGAVSRRLTVADANMLQGVAFVPNRGVALVTLLRTRNLVPVTRLAQGWTVTAGLGVIGPDGTVDQVLLDEPAASFPDPMDVAVSPDGRHALVTSSGSDQVAVVDVAALLQVVASATPRQRAEELPNDLGLSRRFVGKRVPVGRNPRGVVFSGDGRRAFVANALDDSITVLDAADFTVERVILLGGPAEESRLRRGERIFHSAARTFGRQFSCRTCHPEGHTCGLAFDIEADGIGLAPLQVRTLRGIYDTPPYKWEGTNPSLHAQCGPRFSMFFTRLAPLPPDDLDALVRYVSTIERPENRYRRADGLTPSQRRGKIIFERMTTNGGESLPPEQRCAGCHTTPYFTARTRAPVGTTMWLDRTEGLELIDPRDPQTLGRLGIVYFYDTGAAKKSFDAPHLNNVYDRSPFLHNGSANTLEEIWTRFNVYEDHGLTGDLTRRQFNDLIAYLKSL